jgi:hypothetical protein
MRNKAGFMILTLLLLTVPVLANAWNLTVKVAGGDTSNYTTVSYGTTTPPTIQKCVSGTFYLYPQTAAAIANVGVAATYKLDGAASTLAAVTGLASGSHVVTVTYPAATPDTASSIVITQAVDGGMIYSKNLNNTWSATGLTGLKAGTLVPVSIAADFNHVIKSYTVGTTTTTVNGTVAGQVIAIDATATGVTPVTAVFALAQKTTATLFAPTSITAGQVVSATITPNSNDDLAAVPYSFQLDGGAFVAQASASYSLSALAVGTHTLVGQVNTANTGSFQTAAMTIVVVSATVTANEACVSCHSTQSPAIVTAYGASIHSQSTHAACGECHTEATPHSANINTLNVNPKTFVATAAVAGKYGPVAAGAIFCTGCHTTIPHQTTNLVAGLSCIVCHTSDSGKGGTGDAHAIKGTSCVGCHAVGQGNPFTDKTLVNDNAGVRAVTGEFTKWSHHIVNAPGVAIVDEQCAVCHLEGTVGQYGFGVDGTKHMVDNKTHLRNVQDDTKEFAWNPEAPNHSDMDNFCMACHSAAGATSQMSLKLQALITPLTGITASPLNPFGDTISNKYDKMMRPAVVNVDNQFDTANNSHHGVKGARYTGRTRAAGARQIQTPAAFAANSSAALQGKRSTIYDAGNFNALYTPLANAAGEAAPRTGAASLGDDSTLHCGDCHTVGQWKAGSSTNADGSATTAVIGAHGSNNEYMLRNTLGTDARHTQNAYTFDANNVVTPTNANGAFLVCYNCHAYKNYGSVYGGTGLDTTAGQPHVGEYAQAGRCNGPGNTISFAGYTTGKAADGTQFESRIKGIGAKLTGEQNPEFGNVFGIQCANCHNSGAGNAYGGIHGSANNTNTTLATVNPAVTGGAYIDGMGNTTKVERFLPGLGDAMHVPGTLGGFTGGTTNGGTYLTGGISNDTNWEQKAWNQNTSTVFGYKVNAAGGPNISNITGSITSGATAAGAGCYTLGTSATAATNALEGPSVTGKDGAKTELLDTWGGCDDHGAAQGKADHGFVKAIVRPVTY